ncbi:MULTISPECIES: hypothetical protein [unclassified Nocardioides]|uniref:hypothetical protein n=1 Tax=unclassified Nocardioides TaxID=2615069 RepID=UPI0030146295
MAPRSLPALLLVGLLAVGLSGGGSAPAPATEDSYERVVRPLLVQHGCRPVGFDAVERPRAALVRTPRGRLVLVSAARGRAVYDGRRSGVLVAVCTQRP